LYHDMFIIFIGLTHADGCTVIYLHVVLDGGDHMRQRLKAD